MNRIADAERGENRIEEPPGSPGGFRLPTILTARAGQPDTGNIFSSPTLASPAQTPDLASLRAICAEPYGCWIDSATAHQDVGGRSFWAAEPLAILSVRGDSIAIGRTRGGTEQFGGDPFEVLRDLLAEHTHLRNGAAVGYLGYALKRHIEELPDTVDSDLGIPDCAIAFYEELHEFDSRPLHPDPIRPSPITLEGFTSTLSRHEYEAAVRRALDYIKAGDIYQVNLSQRLSAPCDEDPFDVYLRLRQVSPAPFAAFLRRPDFAVLSSSPERFLHYSPPGRRIETRPIKGTRPRGSDTENDRLLAAELLDSAKDRAENVMIVDLLRNDLGRVAAIGSVNVEGLCELESFAGVHHLVSTIEAQLGQGRDVVDLLRAAFPGGSITGAPKIRAMEIIDELEPVERGIYTGAIGYIKFDGEMDLNVAIRTMLIKNDIASFSVGGGIVADSDPALEYEETMHKASGMIQALVPPA